jgi:hypothetical protein
MKLVTRLFVLGALIAAPLSTACSHGDDPNAAASDDALTSTMGVGTYVVGAAPFDATYVSRITFASGQKYEAEIVSGSGERAILAGSYVILPAHSNNPQSPILTDKPTLVLASDSGGAGLSFELDKHPDGSLLFYASARSVTFTMTKDPTWRPAPTNNKVIACTGNAVDLRLTLDQAQNRRGTLVIVRKPSADRHDPPSITVAMTKNEEVEVPEYVYFEGSHGDQDFYVNMIKSDFERGNGSVELNMHWAEGGQEWSVGATCAFAP